MLSYTLVSNIELYQDVMFLFLNDSGLSPSPPSPRYSYTYALIPSCDAQNWGVSLTTRQPVEYSWMSGNPTPLTKNRTESHLYGELFPRYNCPKFSQRPHRVHIQFKMSKNGHLGPCINTHKITYQLYTNSSRVVTSLLIQTYIKIKNLIHVLHNSCQSHMSAFFSKRPLMSVTFPIAPCT